MSENVLLLDEDYQQELELDKKISMELIPNV
jgi:hypothetical protein